MRAAVLVLVCLLLAACSGPSGPSRNASADYVRQFNAIYNNRQFAYDKAFLALGINPSDASPDQLRTLFDALSNADYDFAEGIGEITSSGSMDTICQDGSFDWKISFPVNDCPDVAALWKAAYSLASDEQTIADIDIKSNLSKDKETADISKASGDLDRWRTSANKVRQDIGLPPQSFGVGALCLTATAC